MEKKTRNLVILATIIIASLLLGSMIIPAQPGGGDSLFDELLERLMGVEDEVEELSDDVLVLETSLDLLDRIHELELRIAVLETSDCEESNGFSEPGYDSDWQTISAGSSEFITHNLGTTELFVYLVGKDNDVTVHQDYLGMELWFEEGPHLHGIQWATNGENEVVVSRLSDDNTWDEFRILIWELPPP
jgi:hypothetical protein